MNGCPMNAIAIGQRLKVYMVEVAKTPRARGLLFPVPILNCSSGYFELEVPEVSKREPLKIKSVAVKPVFAVKSPSRRVNRRHRPRLAAVSASAVSASRISSAN